MIFCVTRFTLLQPDFCRDVFTSHRHQSVTHKAVDENFSGFVSAPTSRCLLNRAVMTGDTGLSRGYLDDEKRYVKREGAHYTTECRCVASTGHTRAGDRPKLFGNERVENETTLGRRTIFKSRIFVRRMGLAKAGWPPIPC